MIRFLILLGVVLVIAGGSLSAWSESGDADSSEPPALDSLETPASTGAEPTATPEPVTNRENCDEIRGNDYLSPEERTWFLENCVTQ